jgi:hypothetical protein
MKRRVYFDPEHYYYFTIHRLCVIMMIQYIHVILLLSMAASLLLLTLMGDGGVPFTTTAAPGRRLLVPSNSFSPSEPWQGETLSRRRNHNKRHNQKLHKKLRSNTHHGRHKRSSSLAGKKGACFRLGSSNSNESLQLRTENLAKLQQLQPYWSYSWSPQRVPEQPDDIEFVPMIWGAWSKDDLLKSIQRDILPQAHQDGANHLLVFNEPDSSSQANMKVSNAIDYWSIVQQHVSPPFRLASPAAVNAKGPWMTEFVHRLQEEKNHHNHMHMDYLAVHWYGSANVAAFQREITSIYEHYNRTWPLWITEFAPADWTAKNAPQDNRISRHQVLEFMKQVLPWLEATEWIFGYSWFSFSAESPQGTCSALFETDGSITALGRYYASVNNSHPQGDTSIRVE